MFGEAGPSREMGGVHPNMSELQKLVNMQPATLPPDGQGFPPAPSGDTPGKQPHPSTTTSSLATTAAAAITTTTASSASKTPSPTLHASPPPDTGTPPSKDVASPAACTVSSTAVSLTNTPPTPTTSAVNTANEFSPRASVPAGPRPPMNNTSQPPGRPGPRPGFPIGDARPSPPSQHMIGPAPMVCAREQISPVRVMSPGQPQMRPGRPGSAGGSSGGSGTPTGMSPGLAGIKSPSCRTPPHSQPPGFQTPSPGASSASSPASIPGGEMRLGHISPTRMGYPGDHRMPHPAENRFVFPRAARPMYPGPGMMMGNRFGHMPDFRHRFPPGDMRYGHGPGDPRLRPDQYGGMGDYRYMPNDRMNHGMQYPHGPDHGHRFPHMAENRFPHPGARYPYHDNRFVHGGGEPNFPHMGENRFPHGNRFGPPPIMPPPPPLSHTNTLSNVNTTNTVSDRTSTAGSPRSTTNTLHGEMSPGAVRGQGQGHTMPSQSGSRSPQGHASHRRPDSLSLTLDRLEGT